MHTLIIAVSFDLASHLTWFMFEKGSRFRVLICECGWVLTHSLHAFLGKCGRFNMMIYASSNFKLTLLSAAELSFFIFPSTSLHNIRFKIVHNKMACTPSVDSDQPWPPPSLISVFAVRMKKAWVLNYPLSTKQTLWSDWADAQGPGWSESSLGAQSLCWFCHEAAHISCLPEAKQINVMTNHNRKDRNNLI